MNTRLQPLSVSDFSGGLNLDRPRGTTDDYSVVGNESPEMLNMEIDPRGGIYTRLGWQRWNAADPVSPASWNPKGAYIHPLSDGTFIVYVANGSTVWAATGAATFSNLSITCSASPHLADFASWGDYVYIACGTNNATRRRFQSGAVSTMTDAHGAYNDTYTSPTGGKMPKCEYLEGHLGYMFAAGTTEGGALVPNRVRWSHPDQVEDWHSLDYLDINVGGGKITGLKSFQDHLLIFKTDSIWALYGYDSDSFQLVRVSMHTGAPSPMAITRSEGNVFFYSSATQGAVYAYNGSSVPQHISTKLRLVMEEITEHDHVHVGYCGRRVWVSVPWNPDDPDNLGTTFVFDPETDVWVLHRPALGTMCGAIEDSDVHHDYPLCLIHGDSGAAAVMQLHYAAGVATDAILANGTLSPFEAKFRTGWIHAGWPERRKSWRRPRFMVARPPLDVAIRLNVFWDYDSASPRRTGMITIPAAGTAYWTDDGVGDGGFFWGDGTLWGAEAQGSLIDRSDEGRGLGVTRSLAVEFTTDATTAGKPWNLNEMMLKFALRRFTT